MGLQNDVQTYLKHHVSTEPIFENSFADCQLIYCRFHAHRDRDVNAAYEVFKEGSYARICH